DRLVLLLHQRLTEAVAEREGAQRSDRVDEQGVRAVERVDEAAAGQPRPPPRLHRAAHLQRELVEPQLPFVRRDAALAREGPQVPVRADVVEAVVVDTDVREVRRHPLDRARTAQLEKRRLARGIELQQRRSELEPLRPLGPAAGAVAALDGTHRRAVFRPPRVLDRSDFRRRELEQPRDRHREIARRSCPVELQHRGGYLPAYATRQIAFDPSSLPSSEPSDASVTPTGRPHTFASSTTKPVTKSSYSPVGLPSVSGTRITLYPVRCALFQEPCSAAKMLDRCAGANCVPA